MYVWIYEDRWAYASVWTECLTDGMMDGLRA